MDPWDPPPRPRSLRPAGVTVLAVFYIVLGSHALLFGGWLATLAPADAPSAAFAQFLARDPSFTRLYGLALLGIAVPFFATGVGLLRARTWARRAVLGMVALHVVGPPFLLGGVLFAALANVYLFGSPRAAAFFEHVTAGAPGAALAPQP